MAAARGGRGGGPWEASPFGACSGDGGAFSVPSSRSWPSEFSGLSSPSTLSRAVGRAWGGQARDAAGPEAHEHRGRGPDTGLGTRSLLAPPDQRPRCGPGVKPGFQLPKPTQPPPHSRQGPRQQHPPHLDFWGLLWFLHPQLLLIHVAQLGFHFV